MDYDHFVGRVQHLGRLGSSGEAVGVVHATLNALAARLHGNEAANLAAQLPKEIGYYLTEVEERTTFDLDEFLARVSQHESVDLPEAMFHARVVITVLCEAVSAGEMADVRGQLPAAFTPLFAPVTDQRRQAS